MTVELAEYQKIPTPFRRDTSRGPNRNKVIEGDWVSDELRYLQDANWLWTEKVDGTTIRVHWTGHKVVFGGRTADAQIPAKLIQVLTDMFPEELFEQKFQGTTGTAVTLYGEGYGAGIQKGGNYRPDMSFVLFDVRIGEWWLRRSDVEDVAKSMGIDVVPLIFTGSIWDAITRVREGLMSQWNPKVYAEGLVGVTEVGLLDRSGDRIMVKIKKKDFPPEE